MGKKEILSELLYKTRIYRLASYFRTFFPNDLKILAYHRICDIDDFNDRELVSASVEDFEWQVAHIKRNYKAMTFEDVIRCIQNKEKLPKNAVVITFDDGFADNYFNAYTVLRKHGVPATFFISTSYIGTSETFWFNDLSRMIMSNPGRKFELDSENHEIGERLENRREIVDRMLRKCKEVSDNTRHRYLASIASQLCYTSHCDTLAVPLSWQQVREMVENGMEFGSHSRTHPILSKLSAQELNSEIHDSKKIIEEKTGRKALTISYPDGGDDAINQEVLKEVGNAGYLLATSYIAGNNYEVDIRNFMLKRIHVERYINRSNFASMLALPEMFS